MAGTVLQHRVGWKIVLQYKELYCKTLGCKAVENCIAIQLLYCDQQGQLKCVAILGIWVVYSR